MQMQNGIVPTMLVAYNKDGTVDDGAMRALLDWYLARGVHGMFALCHSTESHWLTMAEKKRVAQLTVEKLGGKIPVICSGVTASEIGEQIEQAKAIRAEGADAIVFIRNRLGGDEETFLANIERICREMPDDIPLGLYECPHPYKQYITDREFDAVVKTGRFRFLKDTICNVPAMQRRRALRDAADPGFRLYNANCATLLESVRFGYNGFSGIMANFHPELYVWMYEHRDDPRADIIDKYLGMMSVIELRCYPICAKRYLAAYEGLPITDICRSVADTTVGALSAELCDLHELTIIARDLAGIRV